MPGEQSKVLCDASKEGDLPKIKRLLEEGADPNPKNQIRSPLMFAAERGHEAVFFELVKAGADLHGVGEYGGSVLVSISSKGTPAMLQAVLADGIRKSDDISLALLNACEVGPIETVIALVEAGAEINPKSKSEKTPLLGAVCRNRPAIVAELLRRGAKTTATAPRQDFGNKAHLKKTAVEIAELEGFHEVADLLKAAGATAAPNPVRPSTPGTIAESWKLFRKWQKANAPDWNALGKPANEKQIAEANRSIGSRLPEDLAETYRLHNGGSQIFPNTIDIPFYLMPLDEVVDAWALQKKLVDVGEFTGRRPKPAVGILDQWWNEGWVPFASNGGGDYFCVDTAPAQSGTAGQIISHNHETGEHTLLAASLRQYLHELVCDLRDGKYSYDEDEGGLV
jgi:cell wall assembly regulator SMI1